jgi:predicted small lipoprotein YifL
MRLCASAAAGALALTVALLLAGCGQKGPLYLPERGGAVVTAPAEAPPPAPVPSGQPPAVSPAPQPQSTTEPPPPGGTPAPPRKSDTDEDQNPK